MINRCYFFLIKELKTCLYKLSIVDDTLEVLGIPKEYQRLYKMTIKVTVGWIVMACVMDMVDIMWMGYDSYFDIVHICVPFVVNHLLHVSTLNGLIWGTILRSVFYIFANCIRLKNISKNVHSVSRKRLKKSFRLF